MNTYMVAFDELLTSTNGLILIIGVILFLLSVGKANQNEKKTLRDTAQCICLLSVLTSLCAHWRTESMLWWILMIATCFYLLGTACRIALRTSLMEDISTMNKSIGTTKETLVSVLANVRAAQKKLTDNAEELESIKKSKKVNQDSNHVD
jgi:membrane-associated HD superfamily phosphohydrolase